MAVVPVSAAITIEENEQLKLRNKELEILVFQMREQILALQDRLRQYEEKEEVKHNVVAIVPKSEEPEIEEQKQVLSNKEIFRRYAYGYSNNFYEFGLQQYGKNIKLQIFTGYDSKAYIITEDRCYKSKT